MYCVYCTTTCEEKALKENGATPRVNTNRSLTHTFSSITAAVFYLPHPPLPPSLPLSLLPPSPPSPPGPLTPPLRVLHIVARQQRFSGGRSLTAALGSACTDVRGPISRQHQNSSVFKAVMLLCLTQHSSVVAQT